MRENNWAFHLSNLCAGLGAADSNNKIYSSIFAYFEANIPEFIINFVQYLPEENIHQLINQHHPDKSTTINPGEFQSFRQANTSGKIQPLSRQEIIQLKENDFPLGLIAALAVHQNNWDYFLIFHPQNNDFQDILHHLEILTTIITMAVNRAALTNSLTIEAEKQNIFKQELISIDTKYNQMQKKIMSNQKAEALKNMLPIIFHKLKNKLTPILGYSQILLAGFQQEAITNRVKRIEKSANELSDHLNLLRDYFEEEKIVFTRENINTIINNLRPYFIDLKKQKNIQVNLDLDARIQDDQLLPGQLETLIINLIDNAIYAIDAKNEDGGMIGISSRGQADGYKLIVEDNGIGIKSEDLDKVWAPFFSTFPGKIGIGLSVCNKIIANHEAACKINSVINQSTQFHIEFKYKLVEKKQTMPVEESAVKKRNILIVDENKLQIELMKDILSTDPRFQIEIAISSDNAMELATTKNYDLIISELAGSKIAGKDFFLFLKKNNIKSRFILLIPVEKNSEVTDFLQQNKINHITKPIELMKFKRQVNENLN